jgi:hypothetical protein
MLTGAGIMLAGARFILTGARFMLTGAGQHKPGAGQVNNRLGHLRCDVGKVACPCGNVFSTTGCPDDSMRVVRERDREAYDRHIWRSYQLCDAERGGMLPPPESPESEQFHESLHASLDLQGTLWECLTCGRLLFRRPGEQQLRSFLPEKGGAA